jgi:hypothetical protein
MQALEQLRPIFKHCPSLPWIHKLIVKTSTSPRWVSVDENKNVAPSFGRRYTRLHSVFHCHAMVANNPGSSAYGHEP